MKIAFVTSSLNGGGITSYAHEVIDCFSAQHELFVVVGDDSKAPFDRNKVKVLHCESRDTSPANAKRLLQIINDDIRPDVIINSNSVLMTLVTPYVNNDIRIIAVSHSLRYQEADTAGFNSQYADHVVALSTYNKDYLRKRYGIEDGNKVQVIYNFVDDLKDAEQIKEQKKKNFPLRIVFTGGTSPAKTPELVFRIMQRMVKTDRQFEFVFMGAHSPTLKKLQPYKSIQELMKPDARIQFTGHVSREEAERLISTANILLVPSRREGCPMAMLEGMRVGCIVLTSDYKNACRELIENGRSGFVIDHRECGAFVERIIDVIDHHDRYYSFYDECYADFEGKYSYPHWKEQMQALVADGQIAHIDRYKEFSEREYLQHRSKLQRRFKMNNIHKLFHETLKSAVPFFLMYIKTRIRK